jgi:hypothetical protein
MRKRQVRTSRARKEKTKEWPTSSLVPFAPEYRKTNAILEKIEAKQPISTNSPADLDKSFYIGDMRCNCCGERGHIVFARPKSGVRSTFRTVIRGPSPPPDVT